MAIVDLWDLGRRWMPPQCINTYRLCGFSKINGHPCSGKTHKLHKDALNAPVQIKMVENPVHNGGAVLGF
jgi:hypothetical protein